MCIEMKEEKLKPNRSTQCSISGLESTPKGGIHLIQQPRELLKTLCMKVATVFHISQKMFCGKESVLGIHCFLFAFYLLSNSLKVVLSEIREGLLNAMFPYRIFFKH